MVIPVIGYSTDTGVLGGAAAMKSYNRDRYRISMFGITSIYTAKKQFSTNFFLDHYFPGERDRLYASLLYNKYPTCFYGIGNDTSNDDFEKYTPEFLSVRFFYERRIWKDFKVKAGFLFRNQALVKHEADSALLSDEVPLPKGRFDAGPELSLVRDSRDNTTASQTGSLFQVVYCGSIFQNEGGGFNSVKFEARKFFNPFSEVVFAFMAEAVDTRGYAPFYLYPSLGGRDRLRGYEVSRFIDRSTVIFQHDIRFLLYGSFGGAVFTSIGRAGPDVESFFSGRYHMAYGAGLRWFFNREDNMVLCADFALGSDAKGIYFAFGEAY